MRLLASALLWSALTVGCGGGAALMHPAHTLPANKVTVGAGVSGNFALAGADEAIEKARTSSPAQGTVTGAESEQDYVEGALVHTLTAPGVAPWVGARAGVGYDSDAGVTYYGRALRIDGRYAFQGPELALSTGIGFTGILTRPRSDPPIDENAATDPPRAGDGGIGGLDSGDVSGFGIDVPILGGWRSQGDLVRIWLGGRGGYERIEGELRVQIEPDPRLVRIGPIEGRRWQFGGLVGLAVGVKPLWVGIELDVAYQSMEGHIELTDSSGNVTEYDADLSGLTVTPTGAVVGNF